MNSADFKDFLISQELVLLRHNFHFYLPKDIHLPELSNYFCTSNHKRGSKKQKDEDCCLTQNVMLSPFLRQKIKEVLNYNP